MCNQWAQINCLVIFRRKKAILEALEWISREVTKLAGLIRAIEITWYKISTFIEISWKVAPSFVHKQAPYSIRKTAIVLEKTKEKKKVCGWRKKQAYMAKDKELIHSS